MKAGSRALPRRINKHIPARTGWAPSAAASPLCSADQPASLWHCAAEQGDQQETSASWGPCNASRPRALLTQRSASGLAPSRLQDQEAQVARKKRRNVTKAATRSVAGASLEVIQKKKSEKPEARKASREAALR